MIFPDIDFPADAYILVHTGQGANSTAFVNGRAEFYMWKSSSIWSPTGDDALLANETDVTMDFISYGVWNSTFVDDPPADFTYEHSNASAEEGFSLALVDGELRQSIPTPLEHNREDVHCPLLITEVYYYPYSGQGEYVKIHNPLESAVDISFWYLTDGEGVVFFPAGTSIPSGEALLVAQNSTNYYAETLVIPDFEYGQDNATIDDMTLLGTAPQLTNNGDEIMLMNNFGSVMDAFAYGDSTYSGSGWQGAPSPKLKQGRVAKRIFEGAYVDANTSADWESLRPYGMAQSEFQTEQFTVGHIQLFTSPDSSFQVIVDSIDSAQTSILINLYEFTNTALADRLYAALARGVEVKLFLEGAPVSGVNRTEWYIASQITERGGEVRLMTNDPDNGIHQRYDYVHAKYMVVDNTTLTIISENWG
ncbi:MAG: lamin tail domain-containing protein, partial [Thermoplasmata archaeon]|nr:lamin tail domain-containing protein [Thermoplasmata archaeon]